MPDSAGSSTGPPIRKRERSTACSACSKALGAWSVKSYNQQRRDARQMIMKAARELNMNVVPEGGSLYNLGADPRLNHEFDVIPGLRADESAALLTGFFGERRG